MTYEDITLAEKKGIWRRLAGPSGFRLERGLDPEMLPSRREVTEWDRARVRAEERHRKEEEIEKQRKLEEDRRREQEQVLHREQQRQHQEQEQQRRQDEIIQQRQLEEKHIQDFVARPENVKRLEEAHQKGDTKSYGAEMEALRREAMRTLEQAQENRLKWDKKVKQAREVDGERGVAKMKNEYEAEKTRTREDRRVREADDILRNQSYHRSHDRGMSR